MDSDYSLNLAIAKYCPNLKILFTIFLEDEIWTLEKILNTCHLERIGIQILTSIHVWYRTDILKVIADHPIKFCEIKIFFIYDVFPSELEFIFEVWKNRTNKLLSVIIKFDSDISKELITNVIEKYEKLRVISINR